MSDRLTAKELARLQNYGFTQSGSAIVDAIWFSAYDQSICMCLILTPERTYKAYIRAVEASFSPNIEAATAAAYGAKVQFPIAAGAFPNRFTKENYD